VKKEDRRAEVMDAAMALLVERGYRETTMLAVAKRASASKETLYAWFGDKTGLFEAIIRRNAEGVRDTLQHSIDADQPPEQALCEFGTALIRLLLGDGSVAINRAAIAEVTRDPSLADVLVESGRDATLPLLVDYLRQQSESGTLRIDNPKEAIRDFLGLLLADEQTRRLLRRTKPPTKKRAAEMATRATEKFLRLYGA